jgi:predicted regulator of Ras-like GTPase activity (Roadblock/LC7/MglB family)
MKQLKEMLEEKKPSAARYRYWVTPPESLTIRVADIEASIPKANWKPGNQTEQTFDLPAAAIFGKNVPRISLRQLSEILPDHVLPSDGVVKLPVARLAAAYHLVEQSEELPPEERPPEPEIVPPPSTPSTPSTPEAEEPKSEAASLPPAPQPKEAPGEMPLFAESDTIPAVPKSVVEPPAPAAVPPAIPVVSSLPPTSGKVPARRTGPFAGLPIFRKKVVPSPQGLPSDVPEPSGALSSPISGIRLPKPRLFPTPGHGVIPKPAEPAAENPALDSPESPATEPVVEPLAFAFDAPVVLPPAMEEPAVILPAAEESAAIPPVVEEPAAIPPVVEEPAVIPSAVEEPSAIPPAEPPAPRMDEPALQEVPLLKKMEPVSSGQMVPMLHTEAMPREPRGDAIAEQEPLQALFLTDEIMSVDRVIELCGGLPGINSCVLAHGSVVVASHNVPDGIDLVSMSAHAAEMLQAMRESSARMGVGTVPAVTLHTEKGVISFFHRDDLTMLVFHRDRGFVPGVREKMAAVLGELTKARLTLPVGGHE